MSYIKYDKKTKKFIATKKRPTNQSTPKVMIKIAERLARYVVNNQDTKLNALQKKYVKHLQNQKVKDKKGKLFSLKKEGVDIVHGIAISKIIKCFVKMLNEPESFSLKKANNFADNILSTVSPNDDKGRSTLREFFQAVKNEDDPKDLCESVNEILKILNRSTRNLGLGSAPVNRGLGEAEDLLLMERKDGDGYVLMTTAKNISQSFKKLPSAEDYTSKTKKTKEGKTAYLSSSIFAKKENSYVVKSYSDSDSSSEFVYKTVPAKHLK